MPGDRLEATVSVASGAYLTVESPGAVRVFPSPRGVPATSATDLSVAAGGSLWWLPGTLIPYRDARLDSRMYVRLEPGATFALLDILTPGRTAMGERAAYARLDLRTRIDVGDQPVLIERALLDPAERPNLFERATTAFRCSGTLILVGYEFPRDIELEARDVWLGADGGPELAIVRAVSPSAAALRSALVTLLDRIGRFPTAGAT
jgi:urease accessory protein